MTKEAVTLRVAGVGRAGPSKELRRRARARSAAELLSGSGPTLRRQRRRSVTRSLCCPAATWYSPGLSACCSTGKVPGKMGSGARFPDGSRRRCKKEEPSASASAGRSTTSPGPREEAR